MTDLTFYRPSETRQSTPDEVVPHDSAPGGSSGRREATPHPHTKRRRIRYPTPRAATPPGFQPERQVGSEKTAFHQLYFPKSFNLEFVANKHAWDDRLTSSEKNVFVLVHQVNDEIVGMHVYTSPNDANADVMRIMARNHPEAFAVPKNEGHDNDYAKIKAEEEPERAETILQRMDVADTAEGAVQDQRSVIPISIDSEPMFIFWGEWKFTANCLKMEARMRSGSRVKAFVSLKHLRKPRTG